MFMNKVICRFLCDVTLAWYFCNYVWVLLLNLGHEYSFFLHLLDLGKQRQWEMQERIMTSWTSGLREQTLELAICLADKKLWILVSRCSICRWLVLRVLSTPLLHYMEHQDVFFALNFDQNGWLWTFQLVLYSLCFVSKIQLRHKIELIATCYNRCKIGNYCNHYKIAWQ